MDKRRNKSANRMVLTIASVSIGIILYKLQKKLNSRIRLTSVSKAIKLDLRHRTESHFNEIQLVPVTISNDEKLNIAESLFDIVTENSEYLSEYLPWPKYIKTVDDERNFIQKCDKAMKQDMQVIFAIMLPNNKGVIGSIGFNYIDWNNSVGFIGYWLASNYQKNGIMTQSVKQLMKFGFEVLKLDHIQISAAETNHKSRGIPQRLNFTQYDNIKDIDSLGNQMVTYILSVKSPKISSEKSVPNYFYRDVLNR